MSNLISREAILKHIEKTRQAVRFMDDIHEASTIMYGMYLLEEAVRNQTSAQPEERTEEHTETHACDLISRQEAVECDGFREVERDDERRSN